MSIDNIKPIDISKATNINRPPITRPYELKTQLEEIYNSSSLLPKIPTYVYSNRTKSLRNKQRRNELSKKDLELLNQLSRDDEEEYKDELAELRRAEIEKKQSRLFNSEWLERRRALEEQHKKTLGPYARRKRKGGRKTRKLGKTSRKNKGKK